MKIYWFPTARKIKTGFKELVISIEKHRGNFKWERALRNRRHKNLKKQKCKSTYFLPRCNLVSLKLLPRASNVGDGRRHKLLLHCLLALVYVLEVVLHFFLPTSTIKKFLLI